MSRIDANIATQVADVSRPQQAVREIQAQNREADRVRNQSEAKGGRVDADDLRATADQLKQVVEAASGRRLNFAVEEDVARAELLLRVTDTETGEVVRQIPSEEALKLRKRLQDWLGLLFDQKA